MRRHAWGNDTKRSGENWSVVRCTQCKLLVMKIDDQIMPFCRHDDPNPAEYVGEVWGLKRWLKFAAHAPLLSPEDPCPDFKPKGMIVYHRSGQEWFAIDQHGKDSRHFILPAAAMGIVIDDQNSVKFRDADGVEQVLKLDPHEFDRYWSHRRPPSVWERLRRPLT